MDDVQETSGTSDNPARICPECTAQVSAGNEECPRCHVSPVTPEQLHQKNIADAFIPEPEVRRTHTF